MSFVLKDALKLYSNYIFSLPAQISMVKYQALWLSYFALNLEMIFCQTWREFPIKWISEWLNYSFPWTQILNAKWMGFLTVMTS